MINVQSVVMQTPIEIALGIDENGMTTARKLYAFLELASGQFSRWAKTNIIENSFAEEGIDYWGFDINVEGNITQDYKLTSHFAKKLSCKGNGDRAEQAREYFTTVEEKTKEIAVSRQQLSPQMQMLYGMLDQMAQTERNAKEAKEIAQKAVETTENIKEAVKPVFDNWREEINAKFNRIQKSINKPFNVLRTEMYSELEYRAGCDLSTRLRNKKQRMADNGCTKTEINGMNRMDIIEEDKKLREIFSKIVLEYEIKYCA